MTVLLVFLRRNVSFAAENHSTEVVQVRLDAGMVMLCICQLMPNELFAIELKNLSIARRCGRNNTVSAGSADEQQLRLCVSEGQLRFLKLPRMISRAGNRCQTGGWCDCTYPREQLWMRQGDEQRLTPAHGKAGNSGLLAPRRGGKNEKKADKPAQAEK